MSKKILGIDPGYGRMGYAVLDSGKLIEAGCFETSKETPYEERLRSAAGHFKKLMDAHQPDVLALEKLFINTNQKTATRVAEIRGILLYLAGNALLYEFTPPEIKLAVCGYGRADKKQVAKMVKLLFKTDDSLNDDALDAIAIAFTASGRL